MTKAIKRTQLQADQLDWDKGDGLLPAIIQDACSKDVLMLGYMNKESLDKTLQTKQVTFFSRSKNALWTKGETSGNVLELISIEMDCDRDTLLIHATPAGPTCHTGSDTCFGDLKKGCSKNDARIEFLNELSAIIKSRRAEKPENSYVAKMLDKGREKIAQKVGEEGVEVALAHMSQDIDHTKEEAADLIFHTMLLLEHADISLGDICAVLQKRHQPKDAKE